MITVTKSDYKDGDRGYYTIIKNGTWQGLGLENYAKLATRRIRAIYTAGIKDDYLIRKIYTHWLNGGDIKIYGVGNSMSEVKNE